VKKGLDEDRADLEEGGYGTVADWGSPPPAAGLPARLEPGLIAHI